MKFKKTLLKLTIVLLILFPMLAACASPEPAATPAAPEDEPVQFETPTPRPEREDPPEPEEDETEDVPDDDFEMPERGTWDGSIYESEFLGLRFVMPTGWISLSDDEIAEILGLGGFGELGSLTANVSHEMMAANFITNETVQILFERGASDVTIEEALQNAAMGAAVGGGEVFDIYGTTIIGSYEYHSFGSIVDLGDFVMLNQQFLRIQDDFLIAINISLISDVADVSDTTIDDILALFSDLSEPAPEIDEIEVAEVLLGTWDWDWDDSYSYVFLPDGTGTRGFPNALEDITWFTDGDHLVISNLESWTFNIVDDVLTITSRQVPGLAYSYIRRP